MLTKRTPKTKKGQLTEKRIFDAALSLIKLKGYEHTTLVDICEAAEVSNGTFYHHFKSKEDLLISYIHQEETDIMNYYQSLQKDSYAETLQKVIKYQISYFIIKGYEFVSNFYSIMLLSKKNYYDYNNFAIKKILLDCFEKGQQSGDFTAKFSAKYMCEIAFSLLYTTTTEWCMDEGNFDLHEDIREKFLSLAEVFKV
jgi:Transcriptional regulator